MPDWSRIHREKRLGPWTLPLALCSAIYGLGVRLRLGAYATDIFRGETLPGFVVSVGNLTAGGTGKTPAVVMLAQWAIGQGSRVAVLSRGYGSQGHQDILEVSDGQGRYADVRMAGDEPALIARAVPESPVIISRNRHRAGIYAYKKFGSDFFILDDGFQHLQLKRDLDLVLMDATDPFGNGHLLPWGPLREPVNQLSRADAFILTRFSKAKGKQGRGQGSEGKERHDGTPGTDPAQDVMALLKGRFHSIPVFCADHEPDRLVFPLSAAVHDPTFLREKRVVGFAGIAHTGQFEEMLTRLGAEVVQFRVFRDHCPYRGQDMNDLIRTKEKSGAHFLLTTEKDWMRIAPVAPPYTDLAYLCIRFSLLPGEDGVFRMIRDGLKK
jgi:tetraacyldisaccharide 4'-kinase